MKHLTSQQSLYRAVCRLAPKAEKLDQTTVNVCFADAGHLQRILNNTNQYIEGRRGTGKTHLLMYSADLVNANLIKDNRIAVYVDLRDVSSESGKDDVTPKERAKKIFKSLLQTILNQLRTIDSTILWHNSIPTARTTYDLISAKNSHDALAELASSIEGSRHLSAKSATQELNSSESTETAGGLDLDVSMAPASPKLSLLARMRGRKLKASTYRQKVEYDYKLSYIDIRNSLFKFMDANSINECIFFIDEWSSVELDAQPYLAQEFKRLFLASSRLTVKIAVLPFQTKFLIEDEKGNIGLDKQGDIFSGLDLDSELVFGRHPERAYWHLGKMLLNHLRNMIKLNGDDPNVLPVDCDILINSLFTASAYRRLLIYSQGNPRDFLSLFKTAFIHHYDRSFEVPIGSNTVDEAAKLLGSEKFENINTNRDAINMFNSIVAAVLQKEKKSTFVIPVRFSNNPCFAFLVHHRLLHVWDRSYSSANIGGERQMVIAIDHAIIGEHLKAPNYRNLMELPFTDEAILRLEKAREHQEWVKKLLSAEKPDKRSARYISVPESIFLR